MAQKDNRSIQNIGGLMGNVKVITVEEIEKEKSFGGLYTKCSRCQKK